MYLCSLTFFSRVLPLPHSRTPFLSLHPSHTSPDLLHFSFEPEIFPFSPPVLRALSLTPTSTTSHPPSATVWQHPWRLASSKQTRGTAANARTLPRAKSLSNAPMCGRCMRNARSATTLAAIDVHPDTSNRGGTMAASNRRRRGQVRRLRRRLITRRSLRSDGNRSPEPEYVTVYMSSLSYLSPHAPLMLLLISIGIRRQNQPTQPCGTKRKT